jgi:hypothetical protein
MKLTIVDTPYNPRGLNSGVNLSGHSNNVPTIGIKFRFENLITGTVTEITEINNQEKYIIFKAGNTTYRLDMD